MASISTNTLPTLAVHKLGNAILPPTLSSHLVFLPARKRHLNLPYLSCTNTGGERRNGVIVMATGETSTDPMKPVTEAIKPVQEFWEKTDDKLAIGGLGFAAIVVLWASTGLIAAIDKLPLIPSAFEFIGILFSGWFVYRYLLFQPDREELVKKIQVAISQITGQ